MMQVRQGKSWRGGLGMTRYTTLATLALGLWLGASSTSAFAQTVTYVAHYSEPFHGPMTYRDPDSQAIFYVESDGRHLARIGASGEIAWLKDPHADAKVEEYRFPNPQIVSINGPFRWQSNMVDELKPLSGHALWIRYSNSQAGLIDMRTGAFTFMGQD
jgi:hypothetical protein